jgi:membrane fusion protein (multidrug efflux system)
VGQKEADDAQSNVDLARANMRAAQAKLDEVNLNLGYTKVVSPITGLSSRAPKSEGSLVTANDTLLTMVWQVDPIWVPFNVSEVEQLLLNRAVASGRLVLPKNNAFDVTVRLADGSTFPRKGTINFSDTRVNPSTGTYEMRAQLANGDGSLKPGQFVRVSLKGAVRKEALAVPQVAVLDGTQGKYVYVVAKDKDGKDIAQVRVVTLGAWTENDGVNLWIVESGLKAGDTVIVDGIARLQPGGAIATGGAPGAPGGGAAPAPGAAAAPAKGRRRSRSAVGTSGGSTGIEGRGQSCAEELSEPTHYVRSLFHRPPGLRGGHLHLLRARRLAAMRTLPIAQYPEIAPPVGHGHRRCIRRRPPRCSNRRSPRRWKTRSTACRT